MRAVRYDAFGVMPYVAEVDVPEPIPGGAVIQVTATGLCRSDWHGWMGHDSDIQVLPHTPGHEFAGVVTARGAGVEKVVVGQRVTVPFVCACGSCRMCDLGMGQVCEHQWQPGFHGAGSFAEYVSIPHADVNIVAIPDEISDEVAAALGCRTATAYRAVVSVGAVQPGDQVVVVGCGGVGLSAVMIAAAYGATVTAVDIDAVALDRAIALGASHRVQIEPAADTEVVAGRVRELTDGADVSIDALGSIQSCAIGVASLRPRGRHVQVGLLPPAEVLGRESVPMNLVIGRELQVLGSHGLASTGYADLLFDVAAGRFSPQSLIARTISLDEACAALSDLGRPGASPSGMTIIDPRLTNS